MDYRLANLIGSAFCGKFPAIHEAYPGLFEEPDKVQDWRIAKERLMRYAEGPRIFRQGGRQPRL